MSLSPLFLTDILDIIYLTRRLSSHFIILIEMSKQQEWMIAQNQWITNIRYVNCVIWKALCQRRYQKHKFQFTRTQSLFTNLGLKVCESIPFFFRAWQMFLNFSTWWLQCRSAFQLYSGNHHSKHRTIAFGCPNIETKTIISIAKIIKYTRRSTGNY